MPLKTTGVAIGVICWPNNGISREPSETGAINDVEDTEGFGRFAFQSVEASWANETARGSDGRLFSFEPFSKTSIICCMGVMPAIGSLENGKLNAIAPLRW